MLNYMRSGMLVSLAAALCPMAALAGEPALPESDSHTLLLLHLDEGKGGSAADASPSRFRGKIEGAEWNVGRFGYGLAFDGSGVYMDVANDPKLCPKDAVTVEAWVKLEQPHADAICKNLSYFMRIEGSLKAYFFVDRKWRILDGSNVVPPHRWTHVAMSYDRASRTMRTFIDGALDAEKKLDGLKSYELGESTGPLRIGRNTWRVSGGVVGKVDEVHISDVARSFTPLPRDQARPVDAYVPNGSFEFGRYGWRSSYESNSRLEWQLDSDAATHGKWSLRSIANNPVTVITKPIAFTGGPDYVLSADLKADAEGRRVTLGLESTHRAKRTRSHRVNKGFTVGREWSAVSLPATRTQTWQTGFVHVSIGKREGTLWIDNVRLRRADAATSTDVGRDAVGIRFLTGRMGDTFFADTGAKAGDAHVVNASSQPRKIRVTSAIVDFFGRAAAKVDRGTFELAPYEAKPLPFSVDTGRRGPFRVDFEIADAATQQSRSMSYRYNVIQPLKGVGDAAASPFGMNTHMEREPNEHLACNLEMLSQCGVKWIRAWWGWGMAEKQPGQFDWGEFDRQRALVTQKQMHIMPILLRYYPTHEHAWAGLVDRIQRPPYKLEQWGNFVSRTVSRFRGRVRAWEIWNEPGCVPDFTPELYAEICKVTYAQARQADPTCKLVGFAGVGLPYIDKAGSAGALEAMDIVGEHSYGQLARPEGGMPERCEQLRSLLGKHHKPMPIWHTEQGTGADGDGYVAGLLSEDDCAASLVKGYVCALAAGVEKFFWFSSQTSPTYGWAVFYEDYVPRPRLVALNGMACVLEGAAFRERVELSDNVAAYVFEKGKDAVAVAWNLRSPLAIAMGAAADIKTVDMMGNVRARARRGTKFEVALGHGRPVYLVFAETTAKQAGRWLSAAAVLETPLWHIDVSQRPEARIEVRITSKADRPLDAAVWMACQPQVRVTPAQRFVLDVPPGGTRVLTFRCEAGAAPLASVTATVGSGPFRMRETQVAKPLPR